MVTKRSFGSKAIISPNYDETYIVTPWGTWVPEGDVDWLLSIKWRCPACDDERVNVFGLAVATEKQFAHKPKRSPRSRNDKSIYGQRSRRFEEEI